MSGVAIPETDELTAAIANAQAELSAAMAERPMRDDPYRQTLAGLSSSLGVFLKSINRWETATQQVVDLTGVIVQARQPFPQEERDALALGVIATVQTAVHSAARKELAAHVHTLTRAHATWLACMIGGGIVLGVAGTLGTLAWTQAGPYAPEAQDAAALAEVARNNPGIAGVLAKVTPQLDKASGKRFGVVSVWLQPAPSAPATVAAAR